MQSSIYSTATPQTFRYQTSEPSIHTSSCPLFASLDPLSHVPRSPPSMSASVASRQGPPVPPTRRLPRCVRRCSSLRRRSRPRPLRQTNGGTGCAVWHWSMPSSWGQFHSHMNLCEFVFTNDSPDPCNTSMQHQHATPALPFFPDPPSIRPPGP